MNVTLDELGSGKKNFMENIATNVRFCGRQH